MKSQYASTEVLTMSFPPFFVPVTPEYVIDGLDTVQFTVKKPDTTTQIVVPTFDSDVKFWKAEIPVLSFQEGLWLIRAESDVAGSYDQYRAVFWGDYVDDIGEIRQMALGRWRIVGSQLIIYEDDKVTPFKTFDLLDAEGLPNINQAFERNPV